MPGAQPMTSERRTRESKTLEHSVTVSIPYWRCQSYVRQAVESILQQTHRNLTLVLVNDGDKNPPWDLVADIDDPRLVRFDLGANRGLFFVNAAVLEASQAPFFVIQDADDWSEPDRIARLLDAVLAQNADAALSYQLRYEASEDASKGWVEKVHPGPEAVPDERYIDRVGYHHGLFRRRALRDLGGYFGGFRIGYDSLLMNLLLMTGKIVRVDGPLYHRRIRKDSLVCAAETGFGSPRRQRTNRKLAHIYRQALDHYRRCAPDERRGGELAARIRSLLARQIPPDEFGALVEATRRLQDELHARGQPNTPDRNSHEEPHMPSRRRKTPPKTSSRQPVASNPSDDFRANLSELSIADSLQDIEGWLTLKEANLMTAAVLQATALPSGPDEAPQLVEVGSFCGRSTVTIGKTLRHIGKNGIKLCAIDPHAGFKNRHDTEEILRNHLRRNRIEHLVDVVKKHSTEVSWSAPIGLLFVDGLHDYDSIRADYEHFAPWLGPQSLVAFHDYGGSFPGVTRYVDELLRTERFRFLARADSLIVVEHDPQQTDCSRPVELRAAPQNQFRKLPPARQRRAPRRRSLRRR